MQARTPSDPSGPSSEPRVFSLQIEALGSSDFLLHLKLWFFSRARVEQAQKLVGFCREPGSGMRGVQVRRQGQGLQRLRPTIPD